MRRILILRGGALGDFIVTLPLLAALRERWPRARIELAGNAVAAELARRRGLLDAVHSQHEARWSALFAPGPLSVALRDRLATFDLVVNFWPDPDGVLARHFPVRPEQTFLCGAALPAHGPASAHYASVLQPLGIEATSTWFRLAPVSSAAAVEGTAAGAGHNGVATARATAAAASRARVAVHPGSGSGRKNWPAARWRELLAGLSEPVMLVLGEAEERDWSDAALRDSALAPRIASGGLTIARALALEDAVAALAGCRVFVGHDAGMSHLAAACGVPCMLLFGPTDPAIWAPPAPHVQVIAAGAGLSTLPVAEVRAAIDAALR